ncbi:MAG: glycosyltransferase [Eubacterium sp.]|nr:glycosyltransferase [Eubacterium sp.]
MIRTISIITVSCNSGREIIPTMESVLAQDCEGAQIEYRIIDGASTDGTADIARSYCRRMEQKGISYEVVSEPDHGIYDAMNKGIRLAGGDLIGFINSGDWYEPGALQKALETFCMRQCDLMFGSIRIYRRNGSAFVKKARQRRFQTSRDWNHPAMFVKSWLYKKYPFPDQGIHDDYGFYLKMRTLPVKIVTVNEVLANFRMGGASNQKSIRKMCRRIHDRYRYCYRANGYSRWYLIECIVAEMAKCLLG